MLNDFRHSLFHFCRRTEELPPRYLDDATHLHQGHEFPKGGLAAELLRAVVVTLFAILLAAETAYTRVITMPKIASHALRHLDFATLVVEVGRRVSGIERYAVMGDFAHDAAAQTACVDQRGTPGAQGAAAACPLLGEESLACEVLVELIFQLHLHVSQHAGKHLC